MKLTELEVWCERCNDWEDLPEVAVRGMQCLIDLRADRVEVYQAMMTKGWLVDCKDIEHARQSSVCLRSKP